MAPGSVHKHHFCADHLETLNGVHTYTFKAGPRPYFQDTGRCSRTLNTGLWLPSLRRTNIFHGCLDIDFSLVRKLDSGSRFGAQAPPQRQPFSLRRTSTSITSANATFPVHTPDPLSQPSAT